MQMVCTFFQNGDCLLHQFIVKCSPSEQQSFIGIGEIGNGIIEKTAYFLIIVAQQIVDEFSIGNAEYF